MAYAATKERARELIERMPAEKVSAVVEALEKMVEPVRRSLAEIPFEDEAISDDENEAAARAKADPSPANLMADFLVELGFTPHQLDRIGKRDLEEQISGG